MKLRYVHLLVLIISSMIFYCFGMKQVRFAPSLLRRMTTTTIPYIKKIKGSKFYTTLSKKTKDPTKKKLITGRRASEWTKNKIRKRKQQKSIEQKKSTAIPLSPPETWFQSWWNRVKRTPMAVSFKELVDMLPFYKPAKFVFGAAKKALNPSIETLRSFPGFNYLEQKYGFRIARLLYINVVRATELGIAVVAGAYGKAMLERAYYTLYQELVTNPYQGLYKWEIEHDLDNMVTTETGLLALITADDKSGGHIDFAKALNAVKNNYAQFSALSNRNVFLHHVLTSKTISEKVKAQWTDFLVEKITHNPVFTPLQKILPSINPAIDQDIQERELRLFALILKTRWYYLARTRKEDDKDFMKLLDIYLEHNPHSHSAKNIREAITGPVKMSQAIDEEDFFKRLSQPVPSPSSNKISQENKSQEKKEKDKL